MPESRLVLVVAKEPCAEDLLPELERLGWHAVAVPDLQSATTVLASRPIGVALLVMDSQSPDAARDFEACLCAAPDCQWVGVFPRGQAERSPWCEHIVAHFFDHHTYPADLSFLCKSLGHAWGRAALRSRGRPDGQGGGGDMGMVGESAALRRLRSEVRKAGPVEASVLIAGESGSGKELVARALHASSRRSKGAFVAVNCGALPPTLIHSELFGHERGSFTGASARRRGLIEAACGGTLFLDEVAELPLETQATLLRFLEQRSIVRVGGGPEIPVDVRVIAASHVDLAAAAESGRFRPDLYFRLNVVDLRVPPLRERKEDIPRLARHVHGLTRPRGCGIARDFRSDAMEAMLAYDWPGNVRELFNCVQRGVVMAERTLIGADDLGLRHPRRAPLENLQAARVQAEKHAIRTCLERMRHNVTLAARELGVSRMTLYRLMAKYGITPPAGADGAESTPLPTARPDRGFACGPTAGCM